MASEKGCVTVNWEIRNFSFLLKVKNWVLRSPKWEVEDIERRVWENKLVAFHSDTRIIIAVNEIDSNLIQTEVSYISSCGVELLKGDSSSTRFYLENDPMFDRNRQSNLLNDTMTLCCRLRGNTLKTSEFHIVTVLHSLNHLWTIEKLASSDSHYAYIEQDNFNLRVCLKRDCIGDWMVEEDQHAPDDLFVLDWSLSVKDNCGRILRHNRTYIYGSKYFFTFDIDSNNIGLTLQMELIVAFHGRHEMLPSSQVVRETPLKPNSTTNTAKHKNVSGSLGDDLLLLYREGTLSDATLNTEGKSFSANRFVLAARSQVFRVMFEKDEGQSGVVDIDDVDSETVERMLVYLYADSVEDLEWKEASELYYAADKYEIVPLKEKCADFLKVCLAPDNVCDVLVLADRHSDQELMTHVVNFILGHEEVVSSAQWEEFEKANPLLCVKITKELFLKKGKKCG